MGTIDDLARNLAVRSARGPDVSGLGGEAEDLALRRIARTVATPISRRRALRLGAAAAATSFFTLRTGTAYAACPSCPRTGDPEDFTQFCGHARGVGCLFVCCPPDFHCCQTDTVVVCCKEEEKCGPVVNGGYTCVCQDDRVCGDFCCRKDELCIEFDPDDNPQDAACSPDCGPGKTLCDDLVHCCDDEEGESCCGDGCCFERETCCGAGTCCPAGYTCVTGVPGVCGCSPGQGCGDRCCPEGSTCCGDGRCCSPTQLDKALDSIKRFFSGAGGAAAGASALSARAHASASPGSADAALALSAVADLALLAHETIRAARPDRGFRRRVKAPRVAMAPIAAGPGLDPAAADALTKMLTAEARAWALLHAAAVARARSLGALKAKKRKAALSHARASGAFAGKSAKALRRLPALRATALTALQAGGAAEVTVTYRQVRAFQAAVHHGGLPADLAKRLSQLGLGSGDRRRVARLIVARPAEPLTGSLLIAPLADASREAALRTLAKQLGRLAAQSRRRPITVRKTKPSRVRSHRPHTSGSAASRRGSR